MQQPFCSLSDEKKSVWVDTFFTMQIYTLQVPVLTLRRLWDGAAGTQESISSADEEDNVFQDAVEDLPGMDNGETVED